MISNRAKHMLGEMPPLVQAHFQCANDPFHHQTNPKGYINLGTAQNFLMDSEIKEKINEISKKMECPSTHYQSAQGMLSLREAFSSFLDEFFHFKTKSLDGIVFATGASAILQMLSYTLFDENDSVMIIAPLYNGFYHDMESTFNVKVEISHALKPDGIDFDRLENDIANSKSLKSLLVNHPHNPTGAVLSVDDQRRMIELAKKYKLEIITDEIYALSVYGETSFVSLLDHRFDDLDYREHIHLVYGMAKDFCLSGFKVGAFYSEDREIATAMAHASFFHTLSTYVQALATHLFNDHQWIKEFSKTNQRRLRELSEYIQAEFSKRNIKTFPAESGIFLWCDLSGKFEINSFEDERKTQQILLNEGRISFSSGEFFSSDRPGIFRVCFAQSSANIDEVLKRLDQL